MPRVRAPDLSPSLLWLNTVAPLSLKALRGRIVLLDFWTYGCINCLHILPDLKYLEARYGDRLSIIGVHTAKFDHEQNPESIQQAIARYGISHPVVVDRDRHMWDQYTVKAYPTLIVIDPQGYVVGNVVGEGHRQRLDELIEQLLDKNGEQSNNPLQPLTVQSTASLTSPTLTSPLAFPGKVLADEISNLLFIADSGHHRLVITTLDGTLKAVIGTGTPGMTNGDWAIAQFSAPQGMAFDRQRQLLYVADTGNHQLRCIDLQRQQVTAIAGTGTQNRVLFPHGGKALEIALNSPWDLVQVEDALYIAIAGSHQIWKLDLTSNTLQTWMGTGAEFCVDGSVEVAAFAQPSGITTNGTEVFVADSESSSIRAVTLTAPIARTVCGSGQLFDFGDRDGVGSKVRLQHCLGVVYGNGYLWIADTYNHKIKRVDPHMGECQMMWGSGTSGWQDGMGTTADFAEPSGLSYAHSHLYVADTNNHAIRKIDLTSLEVSTLQLPDLCSPRVCLP